MNKIIPAILIYKEGGSAFFLTGSPQDSQIPQYRPCSPQFWQLASCKWQFRSFVFFWPLTGRWNANANSPSTASGTTIAICFAFGAGQLPVRVQLVRAWNEASRCRKCRRDMRQKPRPSRLRKGCRITMTGLRPSAVRGNGGGGERYRTNRKREDQQSSFYHFHCNIHIGQSIYQIVLPVYWVFLR